VPVDVDPCGVCAPCRKIRRGVHPDVIELAEERVMAKAGRWEPKGGRAPSKDIVVDQVRDLVDHRLAMKRFEGRRRFVLIDPADAMNVQAQNALLKTLEEPPADTTLVLVASSPDVLLPTLRSRCARVSFAPLPDAVLADRLAAVGRSLEEMRLLVALAGGSLGRALELDAKELAAREEAVATAAELDPSDASTWIAFAREQGEDREAARETCELLTVWLRDVLAVHAAGETAPLALADLAPRTVAAAARLEPAEALRRIAGARDAAAALKQNAAPALALERMLIGWFHGELR
jgi:DNA polymerase III subunit delta'